MAFELQHPGDVRTDLAGNPAEDGIQSRVQPPLPGGSKVSRDEKEIIVVSGLPRSGTSMMMKMLEAGGFAVLTDNLRPPDADNPGGYYEFGPVKNIAANAEWLERAGGGAVKIISTLLVNLPADFCYKVIFMQRRMDEVLASQRRMLARRGQPVGAGDDEKLGRLFRLHLEEVEGWLHCQGHFEVLRICYNETMEQPLEQARKVNRFLRGGLDTAKMAAVVDETLYRQRRES